MRTGDIIKHKKFMDVAFLVNRVRGPYGPNQRIVVTGEWVNQGFVKSYLIHEAQKLRLTEADLKDWLLCMEPELDCIRNARWQPLR